MFQSCSTLNRHKKSGITIIYWLLAQLQSFSITKSLKLNLVNIYFFSLFRTYKEGRWSGTNQEKSSAQEENIDAPSMICEETCMISMMKKVKRHWWRRKLCYKVIQNRCRRWCRYIMGILWIMLVPQLCWSCWSDRGTARRSKFCLPGMETAIVDYRTEKCVWILLCN